MKIYLTGKCNSNCIFCRENNTKVISTVQIQMQIDSFDSSIDNRIIFTGREPTVRKDIFDLLISAQKVKAEIRQLNSNGRMFSDIKFVKKIIESGANYFKISLHGHYSGLHERVTQSKGSFAETLKGIRNLTKLGQKENIVLSVTVNSINYEYLYNILFLIRNLGIKKAQLNIVKTDIGSLPVSLKQLSERLTRLRDQYLFDIFIKVKGVPYCLIPAPESLFLKDANEEDYIFLPGCKGCKYSTVCNGVLKSNLKGVQIPEIKAILDLPVEVMIEVESRCNFQCSFCFNRISFAAHGFGKQRLETSYIKEIIDNIKKANVSTVRFTGGEPMLRDDFFELIQYAKLKGLEVRLNTNGSLIESYAMVKEMVKYLDYVLFAMHAYNSREEEKITGFKNSFQKKIRAMRWFKEAGIKILRVNTIASLNNINNLEKFYKLFKKLKVDRWAVNRLIPISKNDKCWGQKEAVLLINKLIKIKKENIRRNIPMWIHVINGLPLCVGDPVTVGAISSGGRAVDGHERFVIDPRKFAKPIYYMDENIGNPLNILECWNNQFMESMRNYRLIPEECKKCFLVHRCKGGNRFCAWIAEDSYYAADPLMNVSNIKKYIW